MDPSHGSSSPIAAPDMSLSIAGLGHGEERSEGLYRGGALMAKSSWSVVQNPWWDLCNSSKGLKRKRVNSDAVSRMEVSGLSFDNDAAAGPILGLGSTASPSPSESGFSTGSRTSSGSMFMRGMDEEGSAMDLGLGLTGHNPRGLVDGCITSLISGGRSVLTSVDLGVSPYSKMNQKQTVGENVVLGLGPSQCPAVENKSECVARKGLNGADGNSIENDLGMQLRLGLSRSSTIATDTDRVSCMPVGPGHGGTYHEARTENVCGEHIPVVDEGSTSARSIRDGGYIPSLLMGRRPEKIPCFEVQREEQQLEGPRECMFQAGNGDLGLGYISKDSILQADLFMNFKTSSGTTSTSGRSASVDRAPKTCKFRGCGKGARGASGLCITHGGGRRCQRQGCNKGAEGCTVYCKSHGGGRRCQSLGCTKSAEGKTDYCIGHGGGRRCSQDGCTKAARGRSGLCIRHGGGKRCQKEGCTKSAEGYSGLCISHGGGRRCQYEGCGKGAQGSTMFCKAHGGGKRCMIQGCNKGAEGSTPLCKGHGGGKRCMFDGGGICTKSVHGGTSFCVAHGGGKRCTVQGCTKSARGRTDFCVRHGGGKRCKFENCTKSAQGSTDFCKAHGGGKRCSWGQEGSIYSEFLKDKLGDLFKGACDRFARGKIGLCAAHSALVQDRRVHGAGTIGNTLPAGIGPGLFHGLVVGSTHKGNHFEAAADSSKYFTHGSEDCGNHGSDSGGSDSIMQACASGGPSEGELAGMEAESRHAHRLSQSPLEYTPGLRFAGSNLDILGKESQHLNKMNAGGVLISNYGTSSLWPGLSAPAQSKSNHVISMGTEKVCVPTSVLANDAPGITAIVGPGSAFHRALLPPQVLVPLSMQRGEFFALHQEGRVQHTKTSNARDETIFNMSSLSLPEERVHGGNIMSLLSGRDSQRLSHDTQREREIDETSLN